MIKECYQEPKVCQYYIDDGCTYDRECHCHNPLSEMGDLISEFDSEEINGQEILIARGHYDHSGEFIVLEVF